MTELETQVRTALRRATDRAPSAQGLAGAVRARRTRARRTTAWGVSGLVAALVALVLVLPAVIGGGQDDDVPVTGGAEVGWRTVTLDPGELFDADPVDVELPGYWGRLDTAGCEFPVPTWGPPGANPCGVGEDGLRLYASETFDSVNLPGTHVEREDRWGGFVSAGDLVVSVRADGRDVVRRILASARPARERGPDVSEWTTERPGQGVTVEVPRGTQVQVEVPPGNPFCARERTPAARGSDGQWRAGLCRDVTVSVTAPTQALADVVAATVRGY